MKSAGWVLADDLNLKSSWGMVKSTLLRKSYPEAPVSSLFLFGNMQELAFQQEVDNNPAKRHHVRFWRTPKGGWLLPGGFGADWLGAATYDRSVGFSTLTLQITHKIEEDTDIERDYLALPVAERKAWRLPYLTLRRGILGEQAWLAWADEVALELAR